MARETLISWCDSTVNVHHGCRGCELWDSPASIFLDLDTAIRDLHPEWRKGAAEAEFTRLCAEVYDHIPRRLEGHIREPTTHNLWRMRGRFLEAVPEAAGPAAVAVLEKSLSCYAGNIHALMKSQRIDEPAYEGMKGFAPTFDRQVEKPGQLAKAISYPDLLGTTSSLHPWMDGLARSIFIDDMSDMFAEDFGATPEAWEAAQAARFQFILDEVITPMTSGKGRRHLYFILTKRPHIAAKFARLHGRFPENCMVMTSVTCWDNRNQKRLADLKKVDAHMRGVSFEPLRARIPAEELDLAGISWMVVGGESRQTGFQTCCAFHCEWAGELLAYSRKHGIRFFMKQLGGNVLRGGALHATPHAVGHGGDSRDWPEDLRVQEMPAEFHAYRQEDRVWRLGARPLHKSLNPLEKTMKKSKGHVSVPDGFTEEDKTQFRVLHAKVGKAAEQFVEGALALEEIKRRKLYKIADHKTYQDYCRSVQAISAQYANKLIKAGKTYRALEPFLREKQLEPPKVESQLSALATIREPSRAAEVYAEVLEMNPRSVTAAKLVEAMEAKQGSTGKQLPKPKSPSEKIQEAHALLVQLNDLIEHNEATARLFKRIERLLTPGTRKSKSKS